MTRLLLLLLLTLGSAGCSTPGAQGVVESQAPLADFRAVCLEGADAVGLEFVPRGERLYLGQLRDHERQPDRAITLELHAKQARAAIWIQAPGVDDPGSLIQAFADAVRQRDPTAELTYLEVRLRERTLGAIMSG